MEYGRASRLGNSYPPPLVPSAIQRQRKGSIQSVEKIPRCDKEDWFTHLRTRTLEFNGSINVRVNFPRRTFNRLLLSNVWPMIRSPTARTKNRHASICMSEWLSQHPPSPLVSLNDLSPSAALLFDITSSLVRSIGIVWRPQRMTCYLGIQFRNRRCTIAKVSLQIEMKYPLSTLPLDHPVNTCRFANWDSDRYLITISVFRGGK